MQQAAGARSECPRVWGYSALKKRKASKLFLSLPGAEWELSSPITWFKENGRTPTCKLFVGITGSMNKMDCICVGMTFLSFRNQKSNYFAGSFFLGSSFMPLKTSATKKAKFSPAQWSHMHISSVFMLTCGEGQSRCIQKSNPAWNALPHKWSPYYS